MRIVQAARLEALTEESDKVHFETGCGQVQHVKDARHTLLTLRVRRHKSIHGREGQEEQQQQQIPQVSTHARTQARSRL